MAYGLITGQMGYSLKREFLGNAINFRNVEEYNFEVYSTDFAQLKAVNIQSGIQQQFQNLYSGDVRVTVFATQQSYQYPSDSLRASRYNVTVSIKDAIPNLNVQQTELTNSGYYAGLDGGFFGTYGPFLLDFKEDFSFETSNAGNRIFNHNLNFSVQTGYSGDYSQSGRKVFAQQIASGIFANDDLNQYGIVTMAGQITGIANTGLYRNYYQESYDLFKNSYSFSRRREELPFDSGNSNFNLNYTVNMTENGIIDVSEKASTLGNISYIVAQKNLDTFLSGSYARCSGKYAQFYNTGIILQDSQYGTSYSSLLPLINTPVRTTKTYDQCSLTANYDVIYTNNPEFSGDGSITAQTLEFTIGEYNQVTATHSFDYTLNRITQPATYFTGLLINTTGNTVSTMFNYYTGYYPGVYAQWPNFNLIKYNVNYPNIKTKASARFTYSNNPTYFIIVQGVKFSVLDYTVDQKTPPDIINEFKIVNPPGNQSILSYGYQSEKGEIGVRIKAVLGKNSSQFYPDGTGSFTDLSTLNAGVQPLSYFLQPLYMYAGQIFLAQFNGQPIEALNWFLNDSKYSYDSDSNLTVDLSYVYTIKKRNYQNYP